MLEYSASEAVRAGSLVVTVRSPHVTGESEEGALLASQTRTKAGEHEAFLFRLADQQLDMAAVVKPATTRDASELIERERAARGREAKLAGERRQVLADTLREERELDRRTDEHWQHFVDTLSARNPVPGTRRVPPEGDISSSSLAAVREGISRDFNRMGVTTYAVLDDAKLEGLRAAHGSELSAIPAHAVEAAAWPVRPGRLTDLVKKDAAYWCRRQVPVNDCVAQLDPPQQPPHDHDGAENGEVTGGSDGAPGDQPPRGPSTVPELVDRLASPMASPEAAVRFGIRPRVGDIQTTVDEFALHSGPADVPATYDFHRLEIAFESVWQELFDQNLVKTGRKLYKKFVELGLDPNQYLISGTGEFHLEFDNLLKKGKDAEAPASVAAAFQITQRQWNVLNKEHQDMLEVLAAEIEDTDITKLSDLYDSVLLSAPLLGPLLGGLKQVLVESRLQEVNEIRAKAERIIQYAREKLQAPHDFEQFHQLLTGLDKALKSPYQFNVYAAGRTGRSINFGVVVTYRQRWTPVSYQVGELVKTVPLAPKEVRRYTRKVTRKLSRSEQEARSNVQSLRTESAVTSRAESEIIDKALHKTNFEMSAQGGFNVGVANVSAAAKYSGDTERTSQETKREFREAVFKAAQEFRQEHKIEVNVSDTTELLGEESGELSNPNDELPVTYLFYELQRRYRIEEKLYRVAPVVLVAQEVPRPSDIDDDWIVRHDWILRRVILDDSFVPAMDYLATKVVGDEHALEEQYLNLQQQRRMLEELKAELVKKSVQLERRYASLQQQISQRADAIQADESEGWIEEIGEAFHGSGDLSPEAMRIREDAAKDAYEKALREDNELRAELERQNTSLGALTEAYTKALSDHLNRRAQIARLQVHVKSNIFYYMQAIWSHEPRDQRYFRLRDVRVPRLQGKKTYSIKVDPNAIPMPPSWSKPHKLEANVTLDPNDIQFDALGDVADLDNLLGFKGNYMLFALKQDNALTDFMMTPYYDAFTGLRDPDVTGGWTLHDFAEYVCCLRDHSTPAQFNAYLPGLIETYQILKERAADDGELVVPTGSLFIEALPGAHPILEDFKLAHRGIDVKRAQAEVRTLEMENLRLAARLLSQEHEDPRIDKKIVIEGAPPTIAVGPDDE